MSLQTDILFSTYIWLGIFLLSGIVFFSIAFWVIVRGGKDIMELMTKPTGEK